MTPGRVTLLGGGVGSSRLATGLARVMPPTALTCIVNTGDDHWRYGLRICPDLDTNMYALAGLADHERGWGMAGDTFRTIERLRAMGHDAWFSLGDLDMATHLMRTDLLGRGLPLSSVTTEIAARCGVTTKLLPATDDEVETRIHTPAGELSFEEWFVKCEAEPAVERVGYRGAADATPAEGALEAIEGAELIVIGPSNPVASIGPMFAIPGLRAALAEAGAPVVAVTPIVSNVEPTSEGDRRRARARAALLGSWGLEHRASAVAGWLGDLVDVFVLDQADADERAELVGSRMAVVDAPTLQRDRGAAVELARVVLSLAGDDGDGVAR